MKFYNLIFAVFHLWRLAITTLYKQSCFDYNVNIIGKEFDVNYWIKEVSDVNNKDAEKKGTDT